MRHLTSTSFALAIAALVMVPGVAGPAQAGLAPLPSACSSDLNIRVCAQILRAGYDAGGQLYVGYAYGESLNSRAGYQRTTAQADELYSGSWHPEGSCSATASSCTTSPPHHCAPGAKFRVTATGYTTQTSRSVAVSYYC